MVELFMLAGLLLFAWLLLKAAGIVERIIHKDRLESLSVKDIPLSKEQQRQFCALAVAKRISQKHLWKEAALYYMEQRIK